MSPSDPRTTPAVPSRRARFEELLQEGHGLRDGVPAPDVSEEGHAAFREVLEHWRRDIHREVLRARPDHHEFDPTVKPFASGWSSDPETRKTFRELLREDLADRLDRLGALRD